MGRRRKARQLPSFTYRGEGHYAEYAAEALGRLGVRLDDLRLLAIEPVAHDGGVAIVQELVAAPSVHAVFATEAQVLSAHRAEALKGLLRAWLKGSK